MESGDFRPLLWSFKNVCKNNNDCVTFTFKVTLRYLWSMPFNSYADTNTIIQKHTHKQRENVIINLTGICSSESLRGISFNSYRILANRNDQAQRRSLTADRSDGSIVHIFPTVKLTQELTLHTNTNWTSFTFQLYLLKGALINFY